MFRLLSFHRKTWLAVYCLIIFLLGQSVTAGQTIAPDKVDERAELTPTLYFLEDARDDMPLETALSGAYEWQKSSRATGNFGYTQSAFWFRLELVNATDRPLPKLAEIRAPYLNHIEYYIFRNGELLTRGVTGDRYSFSQRLIAHPNYLFPIEMQPGDQFSLLYRVKESGPMDFPIYIWNEREFHLQDVIATQLNSIYYGILLFVILFNLFIYYSLKERVYLYYVLFVLCLLTIQSTVHARTFEYFWPNIPILQNWLIQLCVPASVVFSSLFARHFLNIDQHSRVLNICFKIITTTAVLLLVATPFISKELSLALAAHLTIPTSLLLLVTGPILWWQGVRAARFFTLAWAGLAVGILSTMLYKHGLLPVSFLTQYGIQLGSALEAILLSIAIVDRIYSERNERLAAHRRSIIEAEERLQVERRLMEQATHSDVTGLPNRVLFENRVQQMLDNPETQNFTLCLIHLSRFHEIDKTLGHENADRLLHQIAGHFSEFCRSLEGAVALEQAQGNTLYLSNTEGVTFGLLLNDCCARDALDADGHCPVLKLESATRQSVQFGHLTLDLGAKIGAVRYPKDAKTIEELMRKAHIALDCAEREQENLAFYDETFDVFNERRLTLMAELDKAISQDQLALHFQPQLDLVQNCIIGVETLVRWNHPVYGFIPPDEFVTLAERTGIISALTRWVLRNTLKTLRQVHDNGFPLHFSINISAVNLKEPDFAPQVAQLLEEYQVNPADIMLELTETAMMDNPVRALEQLCRLKAIGVQLSIDDFGSGYSSLSYIKKLPIDEIKIDKSLIFDLTPQADDQVVVKTALDMAQNLGYRVVAEGVENQQMLDILTELECDLIQGYFLARPMPLPALQDWLLAREQQQHPLAS